MNYNIGNPHLILCLAGYTPDWKHKDTEADYISCGKINLQHKEQKNGIMSWLKKLFVKSKKSHNMNTDKNECEVCINF